jgi:exodeoxyribonuclease V beta subunit
MLALLETPLTEEGLILGEIKGKKRLNEMGFHFPVRAFNTEQIRQLAESYHFTDTPDLIGGLGGMLSGAVDGYIKGYIDLVFEIRGRYYLADYKSNWLGPNNGAYHQKALSLAMVSHHYSLQYVLYTLALHRYLRLRIPEYDYERHFGGVFYLFLRGMHPANDPGMGILKQRPSADFIEALDRMVEDGV